MKRTYLLASMIMLTALTLSACGPATIVANPLPPQRLLTVTGTGMVTMTPDVAYINVGVHTDLPTAADAVSANNTQTQQVIDSLKQSGVDPKDIRTMNFSIYPNVQYDPQTNQKLRTTYVVDNTVYVTVHKLDQLGDLLDATVKAGANSVNSIQFDVVDKTQETKQARDAAVKDAKTQAQELADAAGVTLGDLQSVVFTNGVATPIITAYGKGGGGAATDASVPIQSGEMTLTMTVSMSYIIR